MSKRGNNEGSIYRRTSDGRWVGALTVTEPERGQKRRTVVRKTQREVQEALRELRKELDGGIRPMSRTVTVGAYLEAWLVGVETAVRDRTHRRYAELLRHHVIPEIGTIPLAELQPADVRAMLVRLAKKPGRGGKPLSAQTVVHCRAALRRALADAVADEKLPRNAAAGRMVAKALPTVKRPLIEPMTPDRAWAIVDAVTDDAFGPLFRLLLWSGLRLGEALALKWDDVDLDPDGWIRVRRTYGMLGSKGRFAEPKTEESRRDVSIVDDVVDALREQRRRQAEMTLDVYGHVATDSLQEAAGRLNELRRAS